MFTLKVRHPALGALACLLLLAVSSRAQAEDLTSFTTSPSTLDGGNNVTLTVGLNAAAPAGGALVNIATSDANAIGGTNITVPAGMTSASTTVATSTVNFLMVITLTASYKTVNLTQNVTLRPLNLRVTDLFMPTTLHLEWGGAAATGSFLLKRDGVTIATLSNTTYAFDDAFAFTSGQKYTYTLYDSSAPTVLLSEERVYPYQINTTENQAVDSRVDPRYSTVVYLDFLFGSRVYRGGLFAGYASDGSKVGRSFAKFPLSGDATYFRAGNVGAYFSGCYPSGTSVVNATIGCQAISNDAWVGSTLKWTNAPAITPGSAPKQATVTYDPAAPVYKWYNWALLNDIRSTLSGDHTLSVAWASMNESSFGWAYFAKKEWDATKAPCVVYCKCDPTPLKVVLNPTTVIGGDPSTATVTVNGIGAGDSASVSVTSSADPIVTVPATVWITGFNRTFTVTTNAISTPLVATITVTYDGMSAAANLTVNPPVMSVTLNPTTVVGGNSSTGTVTIGAAAPAGGALVSLTSNNPTRASVPASVTVPAGQTSATFTVGTTTGPMTTATISATYRSVTKSAVLTIN